MLTEAQKYVSSNLYDFLPNMDKGILNVTADYGVGSKIYSTSSTAGWLILFLKR